MKPLPVSALAIAVLAGLAVCFSPELPAQAQEWDALVDTVILRDEPADADGNTYIDPADHHLVDVQGSTLEAAVFFDDAHKRVRSVGGPVRLIGIVHAANDASPGGEMPAGGAVIRADITNERGCTFFTDPTGVEYFGETITGISDAAGRFLGPAVIPPGAYPPELTLWPDRHTGDSPQQDYQIEDIWVDTVCEEQATITIRVGYGGTVGPLPPDAWLTLNWTTSELAKQPQVRWAGEEIVLEKRWALPDAYFPNADFNGDTVVSAPEDVCPWASSVSGTLVQYSRLSGVGGLVAGLPDVGGPGEPDVVWTTVGDDCVSRALFSSEDPGEADVEALLVDSDLNAMNKHAFLVWYLKIYKVALTSVRGARSQDTGVWLPEPIDLGSDALTVARRFSDDVLMRVQVKGWFHGWEATPRPDVCIDMDGDGDGAGSPTGSPYLPPCDADDEFLQHGYWVLPDDLPALLGPYPVPAWDIMDDPGDDTAGYPSNVIGLGNLLDSRDAVPRASVSCVDPFCPRKTVAPDGEVTPADAIMPALRITVQINDPADAGFLEEADKAGDLGLDNAYGSIMLPYEPQISALVNNGGYDWDSWGFSGPADGPYAFFEASATLAAPGPLENTDLGNQAGQSSDDPAHPRMFRLYTDNRGQGLFFANGDYNLSFDDCDIVSPATPECAPGDVVGTSHVTVMGDYPYFRKHPAVQSNPVQSTWTWGSAAVGGTAELYTVDSASRVRDGDSSLPRAVLMVIGVAAGAGLATAAWRTRRRRA